MTPVAPRIVNEVSYVMMMNYACHFSWQAQYLVSLEGDIGCSAHCIHEVSYVTRMNYACHFSWQAQYLVSLEGDIGCSAHCK